MPCKPVSLTLSTHRENRAWQGPQRHPSESIEITGRATQLRYAQREIVASLRYCSAFCPWNHFSTKKPWTPIDTNENVTTSAIMSATYRTTPARNAQR